MITYNVTNEDALHPRKDFRYNCILGQVYSVSNAMYYMNTIGLTPEFLKKKLTPADMKLIHKSARRRVDNYWELVKLLIVDRVLADKPLINELYSRHTATDDNIKYVITHKKVNGILEEEIPNIKLATYGVKLSETIRDIVKHFGDIKDMKSSEFKTLKQEFKIKMFDEALRRCATPIAGSVNDTDNETLRKQFMK